MKRHLFFIIYDSIDNPVFYSQVLVPFYRLLDTEQYQSGTLISLEPSKDSRFFKNESNHFSLSVIVRNRFFGMQSLLKMVPQIKKKLSKHDSYDIIARGPQAGWIAMHAQDPYSCNSITVQARGILPEEYEYTHMNDSFFAKPFNWIRKRQYTELEKKCYQMAEQKLNTKIEAVSTEMKQHLIKKYKLRGDSISIACNDYPQPLTEETKKEFRNRIRTHHEIPDQAIVYCYNGSGKPWQCPEYIVTFAGKKIREDRRSFFLIVTQDPQEFTWLFSQAFIHQNNYLVVTVENEQVYEYLAASDYGILFREEHIINWVSRPTKVLEYNAAGLTVIHNDTVGILHNSSRANKMPTYL